jgi:hypothetical protein
MYRVITAQQAIEVMQNDSIDNAATGKDVGV